MTAARRDDEQATRDAPVGEMECWSEGEPIKENYSAEWPHCDM
jgi:hypothetical protein